MTSELSDLIWGRLGLAAVRAVLLEYRAVLEEGSERRAAFAQLRSRAHEIAVETVEKKSLSPFNDKVYGLDAHNSRPLGHWRNLGSSCGCWALTLRQALRPLTS